MEKRAHPSLCPAILSDTILGAGVLALWVFVWGMVSSMVSQWANHTASKYAFINRDGDIVIEHYDYSAQYTSYRTVDVQTLTDRRQIASTSAASLSVPHPEHYSPQPLLWIQRIRGYTDGQSPPTYWYLINNGLRDGRAYFVGYEHPSNRIVGYLGTGGFSPDMPAESEQFIFPSNRMQSSTAGYYYSPLGRKPNSFNTPDEDMYVVPVISSGKVYRVCIDRRSVEPLDLDGDVISLSTATIPIDAPTGQDQYQRRLAARTKDKIYLLTYKGKTERAISIPESFQDKDLMLYVSLKSTTILAVNHLVPHSEEFAWVDDTGKVAKNIEVPLLSEPPPDPKVVA
jgi:hypothetical protein